MPNQHPFAKIDPTSFICPINGEFLCGFTPSQVLALRQAAGRNDQDPDQTPGAEWYSQQESSTCGTLKVWFKQGTYDADGFNSIMRIEFVNCAVPCFGHRHIVRKAADQNSIGTSATDVSELSVAVKAGRQLRFRAVLYVTTSAGTIGAMTSVNGPTASLVKTFAREWTSATTEAFSRQASYDAFATNTSGPGASTSPFILEGVVAFTAEGTFVPRIKAESGGTCAVEKGSFMEFDYI